eukprot:CAMPEP_0184681636 /NCGR_PEP_ID=MMETSP0312-20130426/4616_1 /TAXON_ID=31354 /ORGANISM="Compsopogon coeruleus, Strain SAG 36.94" /LENGTH=865 /DNA_ID=CAMNT_0027132613 /DNA_START=62 /DNA_END=2661 /DNA_ORIENTATION=+
MAALPGAYSVDPLGTGVESDKLEVIPLGAGCEVGRSCCIVRFKGKTVMFDCGVHPAYAGQASLPFFDVFNMEEVDIALITHFHLDHCAGLPYLMEKTTFNPKAKVFMTHPTKSIYNALLTDFIRVSGSHSEQEKLYNEEDISNTMKRIEPIDYHMEKNVNGIRFWGYNAGHVLGAAMFMIEIAGVRVLYTGDFSRQEDRHLKEAELPPLRPDVVIIESTYGIQVHESRKIRETRFTQKVATIVRRGGRCLLPVFALGRAQELLLILDEFWEAHPDLQGVPIYYASALARKCMRVFQTYINQMNASIQKRFDLSNPFAFKYVSNLRSIDHFDDRGPCVVMASPGMLQSGLSRELFERWCSDKRNGVILPGYTVAGTLGDEIKKEPEKITRTDGVEIPMRCSVDYITFSAHSDFKQTSDFLDALEPTNVVLVHGASDGMMRLKSELEKRYSKSDRAVRVFTPKNGQSIDLMFRGEKVGKAIDVLPKRKLEDNMRVNGIMVRQDFSHTLLKPEDLSKYTSLKISRIGQQQVVPLRISFDALTKLLKRFFAGVVVGTDKAGVPCITVVNAVSVTLGSHKGQQDHVVMRWNLNKSTDMIADTIATMCISDYDRMKSFLEVKPDDRKDNNTTEGIEAVAVCYNDTPGKEVYEKENFGGSASVTFEASQELESSETKMADVGGRDDLAEDSFMGAILNTTRRLLTERFGPVLVDPADGPMISRLVIDLFEVKIDHGSASVECESEIIRERVRLALQRIQATVFPIPDFTVTVASVCRPLAKLQISLPASEMTMADLTFAHPDAIDPSFPIPYQAEASEWKIIEMEETALSIVPLRRHTPPRLIVHEVPLVVDQATPPPPISGAPSMVKLIIQ